jgi:MFS family permease
MRRRAVMFIVLIGCVSLFADMTYEGGRSIAGPFLGALGAPALVVSAIAGLGEFLGYGVRYFSGRSADRSGRYWLLMGIGYTINLLSVPLLAFAGSWPVAALLLIGERIGRAIRAPIRGAMLSHAATRTGAGWGFGLHTALDQTGGMSGPLLIALLLGVGAGFRQDFAALLLPALVSLLLLFIAWRQYPDPRQLELRYHRAEFSGWAGFGRQFRILVIAASLFAAGFADFALIGFHFARAHSVPLAWIPALYAGAMAAEGVFALILGRMLDHLGPRSAVFGIAFAALAIPLVFLGGHIAAIFGVLLWGIGMATQDTIFQAILSKSIPPDQRATAYGLFDAIRGTAWLAGSLVLGALYMLSLPSLVAVSLALQAAAIPIFLRATPRAKT